MIILLTGIPHILALNGGFRQYFFSRVAAWSRTSGSTLGLAHL